MSSIDSRFSPARPFTCAQGRHGEVVIVQGHGVRPARWDGGAGTVNAGMDPPTSPPTVSVSGVVRYYVARTDVVTPGSVYYAPPAVTYDSVPAPPTGRLAKADAYLEQAALTEVVMRDGGKNYPAPPNVALSATHGTGAQITAVLDAGEGPGGGDPFTGLSQWTITEQPSPSTAPDAPRFAGLNGDPAELPISGNGTFTVRATPKRGNYWIRTRGGSGNICASDPSTAGYTRMLTYRVSGYTSGSGAVLRLSWADGQWSGTCVGPLGGGNNGFRGATSLQAADAKESGSGYGTGKVRVTISSIFGEQANIVLEGVTAANPDNTSARGYPVTALTLGSGGSGYVVAPQIRFVSNSGFGASALAEVSGGRITKVTLTNSGGGYKTPPTVVAVAGGAEAFAVARPHLRGTYQCYYRYVDDTPESQGGPIPSNLSPVREVDTGAGTSAITWSVVAPAGRAKKVELWRTTGNQATLLYRVHTGTGAFVDDLTDEEVRDPDRTGYASMPIVLPNGDLNANRFGVPPSDKAVVVRFQDRFWYGVDTSGKQPNAVLFSEVDEPESVPDVNELVVQSNARTSDAITALIPFGSTLLIMQERHAHSLTFARQPLLDAQVSPIAYRGALNQRCWCIHDGVCYVLDGEGVYSIAQTGQVTPLSGAISNLFRTEVDYSRASSFFLAIDPQRSTLRVFVTLRVDGPSVAPARALCCDLRSGVWWTEAYPCGLRGAAACRLATGDYRNLYAGLGGMVALENGVTDVSRGAVARVRLTDRGSGYTKPPRITASGGGGATFRAVLGADGGVNAIHILTAGHGYVSGELTISLPPAGGTPARAVYDATPRTADSLMYPVYWLETRRLRYVTDEDDPKAAAASPRNVAVLYSPQSRDCLSYLRLLYNNSEHPRRNVAVRNRGVGFAGRTADAAWVVNIGAEGADAGNNTYRAVLEGRSLGDIASADRFVAVEVSGAAWGAEPVTIHAIDVDGVAQ